MPESESGDFWFYNKAWRVIYEAIQDIVCFLHGRSGRHGRGCLRTDKKSEGTGGYIDDTVVTTKVKSALLADKTIKSREISVETFKGRVQLSGFVTSTADANRAVEVTRGVAGVRSIENDMRLK